MQLFELVSPRLFRPLAGPNRAFYKVQSLRARQRLPLRGSWQNRQVLTEGVSFQFLFFCTKCSAGRVFLLTSGQMFRTIISSMESKTLYAGFCVTLYPFQAKRACLI